MATTAGKSGGVKGLGLITIILGIVFIVAGAVTWGAVTTNLAAEKITVSDDAEAFQGQLVDTPWEAWVQADVIDKHALEASGGKTYAELDQDDPVRQTVMTASFLRASLFTSVVAFGVALLVVGIGVSLLLIGFALRKLGAHVAAAGDVVVETSSTRAAPVAAAPAAAPVTAAPTTAAPTTAAPTTAAPTTAAPTTAAPTTADPTTAAPTTAAPSHVANPGPADPDAPKV